MASTIPQAEAHGLPFPDRARESCAAAMALPGDLPVTLDRETTADYAKSLDVAMVKQIGASLANDANATRVDAPFTSVDQEAALIVLMHALDFGGGWRQELHSFHGKGAWQSVKPGVEAIFAQHPDLPTSWLAALTVPEVAKLFGMEGERAAPLAGLVERLAAVCNEVGQRVSAQGYDTLRDWLSARLAANSSSERPAAALVEDLVNTFPYTFDDRHAFRDMEVCLYKKAQLVVGELFHRFRGEDARFAFVDGVRLTAFIDNVICAVCRKLGLIKLSPDLAAAIDGHQELPSGSEGEVALRAGSMCAVELVANLRAEDGLSPSELGNYFWGHLGKVPEFRAFTRHATKDTVFY